MRFLDFCAKVGIGRVDDNGRRMSNQTLWDGVTGFHPLRHAKKARWVGDREPIGTRLDRSELCNRALSLEDIRELARYRGNTPEDADAFANYAVGLRAAETSWHYLISLLPPPPPLFFFSLCIVVTLAFLAGGVVSNGEALAKLQTSSERFLQWWGNALAESNLLSGKATNGIVDLVALNRKLDAQIAAGIWRWQEAHLFSTLELFSGYRSFHFAFVCYNCFYSVLPSKVRAVVRVRANLFLHVSVLLGLSFLKDSSFTGAPVFRSSCLKFVNKLTAEYAVWDTSFLALSRTAFNEDSCCFIRPDCLLLSSIF